jgi:glutathione S-transferase
MKEKMMSKETAEEYSRFHSQWIMKGQEKDQEVHK